MIMRTVQHSDRPDQTWLIYFQHESASGMIVFEEDEPSKAFLADVYSGQPRLGHASELLREIEAYCQENKIYLLVEAIWHEGAIGSIVGNDALQAFYEKNGAKFLKTGKYGPVLEMGYLA